ncbi:MAG: hypothetical protein DRI74_03660 [Bacteroidetes bacterium]|nr:MAG: hypothetical protein DRI74_03660 [Bacteroidota bacterium]
MEEISNNTKPIVRPQLLTVLAILSFIGSGMSFFSYFIMGIYYHSFLVVIQTNLSDMYSQMGIDIDIGFIEEFFVKAGRFFFILTSLAYAVSLYGIYKMWNLQKDGLHYYAISQLVILILPLIFVSPQMPVFSSLLLTTLFILLYYRGFKMIENEK